MKKIHVLVLILMTVSVCYGQVNDVALSENNSASNTEKPFATYNSELAFEFKSVYNINFNDIKFAQALDDIELKEGPFSNSATLNVTIPKGEYLDVYKLLPVENVWAINYNGNLGFIPFLSIMQVAEKKTKADFAVFDVSPKLKNIDLVYPKEAEVNGIEGEVIMLIHITKDGVVDAAEISEGVEGLNEAALRAIKSASFKPAKYEKEKVDVWIYYPINYSLMNE